MTIYHSSLKDVDTYLWFIVCEGAELCNVTLGFLPCFDGTCFLKEQACDGVRQCHDGADEMGCEYCNHLTGFPLIPITYILGLRPVKWFTCVVQLYSYRGHDHYPGCCHSFNLKGGDYATRFARQDQSQMVLVILIVTKPAHI